MKFINLQRERSSGVSTAFCLPAEESSSCGTATSAHGCVVWPGLTKSNRVRTPTSQRSAMDGYLRFQQEARQLIGGRFTHLLYSLEGNIDTHLVLVGDVAQLPAIGPSGFYHQLVRVGNEMLGVPVVTLGGQHRAGSEIYDMANMIRRGEFPKTFGAHTKTGDVTDMEKIARQLKDSGADIKDILFLAPTVSGKYGTTQLNKNQSDRYIWFS